MLSVALWLVTMTAVVAAPYALGSADVGDDLIRNTVRVSLAFWFAAVLAMLTAGRVADASLTRRARLWWTLAWAAFLVHLYMAFEHYHGWSHAHAVQHVQDVSGWGPGIWVSHTFTLLWTLDVAWWWMEPAGRAARSPWIGRGLHGFMVFMIFNGTIVYETGVIRWAGAAMLLTLAAVWLASKSEGQLASNEQ